LMSDFMAVFLSSMIVMIIIALMFFLTLKKVIDLEKRLRS